MASETNLEPAPRLQAHQIRALSVAAETDPRSVRKFLLGGSLQPLLRQRIERALRALGLAALDAPAECRR